VTADVNFHSEEIRYCKIANCQTILIKQGIYYGHVTDNHERFLLGMHSPFWDLIKANLINNVEISLMKFAIRCNVMQIEEKNGRVWFTNDQEQLEKHLNEVARFRSQIGDLRIRKENDGLTKELRSQSIATLTKEEKSMRRVLKMEKFERTRLREEEPIRREQENIIMLEAERDKMENDEIQKIIEKDKDRGYKKGNKPKTEKKVYKRSEENKNIDKQKLRSNAAVKFISHNANLGKW
jgi:hypothetical protein